MSPVMSNGKRHATITTIHDWHAFALDDWGVRYFVYYKAVSQLGKYGFSDLRPGSVVRLIPIEHPQGPRAIDVEVVER